MIDAKPLMLGIKFKENCPDVRNTKILDVVAALKEYEIEVAIYDSCTNYVEVKHKYKIESST